MARPQLQMFGDAGNTALFDETRRYRYRLCRHLSPGGDRRVTFAMLNPSTADEVANDPTVRRCIGYAMSWGYHWLEVVNIFAWRSTDPRELLKVEDPVGPDNDQAIVDAASTSDLVVCAWGVHGKLRDRGEAVAGLLRDAGVAPYCLDRTRSGAPRHPLYLRGDLKPIPL
jgi:hypothetical protein